MSRSFILVTLWLAFPGTVHADAKLKPSRSSSSPDSGQAFDAAILELRGEKQCDGR